MSLPLCRMGLWHDLLWEWKFEEDTITIPSIVYICSNQKRCLFPRTPFQAISSFTGKVVRNLLVRLIYWYISNRSKKARWEMNLRSSIHGTCSRSLSDWNEHVYIQTKLPTCLKAHEIEVEGAWSHKSILTAIEVLFPQWLQLGPSHLSICQ